MKKFKPNRNPFQILKKKVGEEDFQNKFLVQNQKLQNNFRITYKWIFIIFKKLRMMFLNKIGVKIDPNVTMDIHRIFRLPGSINSKSGLTKIHCKDLTKFDPYNESSFLGDDTVEVIANCPIEFRLKNKKFGPFNNEKVTVPTYAAVYMICKKLATIA